MANFISHIIMSEKLYKKLNNKDKIDLESLKLFSIGQDLTFTRLSCFNATHKEDPTTFFIETINYIKNNNLENNKLVMSYLYGHIAHYALDKEIHPIVGALSNNILSKSIIKPHTYIECLFDKYLLKSNKIDDYSFINCKSVNNKVLSKLINNTYRTSYGMLDIRRIYESTILIIKRANKVLNRLYNNDNLFKKITRIDKYNKNSTFYKFVNSKNITKKILFRNILHSSINEALKMIDAVNKYLYQGYDIKVLYEVFTGVCYDTGAIKKINYDYNKLPIKYKLLLQTK